MTNFKLLLFKLHSPRVMQKSISASLQVVKFSAVMTLQSATEASGFALSGILFSITLPHGSITFVDIGSDMWKVQFGLCIWHTNLFKLPLILQMLLRLGLTNEVQKRELLASVRVYPKSKDLKNYFKKNNSKELFVLTSCHL